MKKIIFSLILLIGVAFMAAPVYANEISKQVDIGSFDVWRNSAGTWIPSDPPRYTQSYRPKVEDIGGQLSQVHILGYKVSAPANIASSITGVKSVTFVKPENAGDSYDGAVSASNLSNYTDNYSLRQVTSMTNLNYNYLGNGQVEITSDIVLEGLIEPRGFFITKPWQGGQVQGCRFYLPVLIEWETSNPPDFFPTPEGSTEWKPSYKDPNICAMTYTDAPGTNKNILVNVNNSGTEAITDFKATWYGSGAAGWANPVWDAGKINIPAGGSQQFTVPVIVPQPGQENRLVFKANVNGQNPASETNQENNIMIIRVGNPPVDLQVTIQPTKMLYLMRKGCSIEPGVTIRVKRIDAGTNTVQATFTYQLQGKNPVTKTITLPPNYWEHHDYITKQPGSFTTKASAYPIGVEDINPADNTASCTQKVILDTNTFDQQKDNSDGGIRGAITG